MWSKTQECCRNCETQRFPHNARGFCNRCYPWVYKRSKIKNWNSEEICSLKGLPSERQTDERTISLWRKKRITEIEKVLAWIKAMEKLRGEPVSGMEIETQLKRIASFAGVKRQIFHGWAGYFDEKFNSAQQRILFDLLLEIEENVPITKIKMGLFNKVNT